VKTEDLQCGNDKPFLLVSCLLKKDLASAKHLTSYRILNFLLRAKDV